jgi:adenylate cyclase
MADNSNFQELGSRTGRKLGFRTAILRLVLGALLLAVTCIGIVGYINSALTFDEIREKNAALVSLATSDKVSRFLGTADTILPQLKALISYHLLQYPDVQRLGIALAELLRSEENLTRLSYSDAQTGRFVGARRGNDGEIIVNQSDPQIDSGRPSEYLFGAGGQRRSLGPVPTSGYDPRTKEWYKAATKARGKVVWSEPYQFEEGLLGLTASLAIESGSGDEPIGVITADFSVHDMGTYLARLIQSRRLMVFISTISGKPIALSSGIDTPSELLIEACQKAFSPNSTLFTQGQPESFPVFAQGQRYLLTATPNWLPDGFGFVTGVVGREDEFLGSARANLVLTGLVGFLAIIAAAVLAVLLSERLAKPLKALSRDLEAIGQFQISEAPNTDSSFREISVIVDSSERMKSALRSFGKYVPIDVVRELLAQKQDAMRGGKLRELTLFFSDIADFTAISENLSPAQIVEELGDYFELVATIIESDFGGTLDKFVGDGVVAFFGAPKEVPNHAELACRAALKIQAELFNLGTKHKQGERLVFRTRIGLHTGEVLVGNIGTPKRFAYSVIGDAANLTSRLEALNKVYGTRILASEETKRMAGSTLFQWRCIDRVSVVGRTQSTEIYELLGISGSIEKAILEMRDHYESGLRYYFEQDFENAMRKFETTLKLQPLDKASEVLLRRSQLLTGNPRKENWSGVFEAVTK